MMSQPNTRLNRTMVFFAVLAAASLFASSTAFAGDRGAGGDAARAAAEMQEDRVTSVDVGSGTVTIGETTYRVGERSRLMDAEGRRMRLGELAGMEDGQMVRFRSRGPGAGSVSELRTLEVMEGDFE